MLARASWGELLFDSWGVCVFVKKLGTVVSDANFHEWRDYVPKPDWVRGLWDAHKLDKEGYAKYSRKLRTGHADRKRDLAELEADERRQAAREHASSEMARLKASRGISPLRDFPEVDAFLDMFRNDKLCRRPVLAVVGGTNLGKSVLAADVLRRVGEVLGVPDYLEVTVENDAFLDLTDLDIRHHAGVLLDGVGDVEVLKQNREVLQGRAKLCKAARSPTMRFSSLYAAPGAMRKPQKCTAGDSDRFRVRVLNAEPSVSASCRGCCTHCFAVLLWQPSTCPQPTSTCSKRTTGCQTRAMSCC